MKLFSYFRSSAAYRVRIALNLKGLAYETAGINLRSGAHLDEAYRKLNPQARIPTLQLDDGDLIGQSPAIIEYLEEKYPEPAFLPKDMNLRAKIRGINAMIACDIHPLNNLSILNYLKQNFGQSEEGVNKWYAHWVNEGFEAIEELIDPDPYSFGTKITMADIYLVPQVFNAQRFNVPLEKFPKIMAVNEACIKLDAFKYAHPTCQPDTEA